MFGPLFFYFLWPLGPLRGPRAPKNRILLNFSQNPKIYKKSLFYIKKGPGALKKGLWASREAQPWGPRWAQP